MMELRMTGLDYHRLTLKERELFAFTGERARAVLDDLCDREGIEGCVLIFTCNRTELYISAKQLEHDPFALFCMALKNTEEKKASEGKMECENKANKWSAFAEKSLECSGKAAVQHLFELACGMKSQVFGEDQIITQVKDAQALSRENGTIDSILEKLFQIAVSAAKKVKTEVRLTGVKTSVMENVMQVIEKTNHKKKLCCLVIGNGEMGRLAASRLLEAGHFVTMTVRHYKTKEVTIPVGCKIIDYRERYEFVNKADVIISATASPHHTLLWENGLDTEGKQRLFCDGRQRILFDLAMPRDISSKFSEMEGILLYNVDALGGIATDAINNQEVAKAMDILEDQEEAFWEWYLQRKYIPVIDEIKNACSEDVYKRIEKKIKKMGIEEGERSYLEDLIETSAKKVIGSVIYGMQDYLEPDQWQEYVRALQKTTRKE